MVGTPSDRFQGPGAPALWGGGEGHKAYSNRRVIRRTAAAASLRRAPGVPAAAQTAVCSGSAWGRVRMNGQRTPLLPRGNGCSSSAWNWAVPSETVKVAVTWWLRQ